MSGLQESIKVGDRVRVTNKSHKYYGAAGAVREVTYTSFQEEQKAKSGDPTHARFAKVKEVILRSRGGDHRLITAKPSELTKIDVLGIHASDV